MSEIEQEINTAIKGLTRRVSLKQEHILILENALANPEIYSQIYEKYLNGNNTQMALKQAIYTSEMVRLLTLRAIILPESLLEFLEWLNNRKSKNRNHYQLSGDFQESLTKFLSQNTPFIKNNLAIGVQLILLELIEKPDLLSFVIWLLQSPESLWGKVYQNQVRISLENQLAFMSQFPDTSNNFNLFPYEEYQKIRDKKNPPVIPKYKVLAKLLSQLGDKSLILAIFFYQISSGKVPSKIHQKIKPNLTKLFGITIKEEFNFIRSLRKSINIFRKEMLYCFGRMILWLIFYTICININPSLIILPIIANLPLFSFYLIGLNLIAFTQIFLRETNYYEYYADDKNIMIMSILFNLLFLPYLLNYIYRYLIFKNTTIGFRIKEFFIWIIPTFFFYTMVRILSNYLE
ncbi:hypothetical protein [Geminocystis sp. GBBB08]|uniref:hypothetical protein n=1 Tax=Geminocystis sp. GBBB08 TaxID=2604140 RepID=UPI0027E32B6E|nr:hypothetical protein [Geminocystis sp. GBBB08]MBL1209464.1 hypothetical protein [Geminocystis sp. GBBB08]